jgi:chaperonin cofactor prefoldin
MEEEFEKKIKQYAERFESTIRKGNIKDALKILNEVSVYLTALIDLESDPIWKSIGNLLIYQLQISGALLSLEENISQSVSDINLRLANLEERVARIEGELGFRREGR